MSQRVIHTAAEQLAVNQRPLSRLLGAFRRYTNETKKEVIDRLDSSLTQINNLMKPNSRNDKPECMRELHCLLEHLLKPDPAADKNAVSRSKGKALIAILESDRNTAFTGNAKALTALLLILSRAYGIPRLMLDSLLSQPVNDLCPKERFAEFREVSRYLSRQEEETIANCIFQDADRRPAYGNGATYRIPRKKVVGTENFAIIHLELERDGHSDVHFHPGDELMFVLDGSIDVHFEESGLRTRIDRSGYIHFNSGQMHGAWNACQGKAAVLVLRFYHLDGNETDSGDGPEDKEQLPGARKKRVVLHRQRGNTGRNATSLVSDRKGLGRLLRLICSEPETPMNSARSLDYLKNISNANGLSYTRAKIDRIQHGLSPVKQDELTGLAKVFETAPVLLHDFVSPALPNAVVVRYPEDWNEVDAKYYDDSPGVTYRQPRRRLVDANTSIMLVELNPKAVTPSHHHPGLEIIVPLEGSIDVKFGDAKVHLNGEEAGASYIHFVSNTSHCIGNAGEGTAKLLVIRLYELPLAASPPARSLGRGGSAAPGRRPRRRLEHPRLKRQEKANADTTAPSSA
jgi:quercetin dioxygenase-like cupin family protein